MTDPRPPRRLLTPNRWLLIATVAWALALIVAAVWSERNDPPTARDQTTIVAAQATVDRAIAEIDAAAAGDQTVVAIGPFQKVDSCSVTAARSGARYQRVAYVYTTIGGEDELLDRVASGLPKAYSARISRGAAPRLTADAGDYVAVTGGIPAAGQLKFVADTGCRPVGGAVDNTEPTSAGANRAPVEAVFSSLGTVATEWHIHRVPCAQGGPLWTIEGLADTLPGPLDTTLRETVGDTAIVALPDVYAFRNGPIGLTVRTDTGRLIITATTDCQ